MSRESIAGHEGADAGFGDRSTADLFGESGEWSTEQWSRSDAGDEGGTAAIETPERTAASVFEEVSRDEADDLEAVFDHFDVDSPADVMAADDDPPASARTRNDPLVVGEGEFDVGRVLLDDRREGETFNWVEAESGETTTAAADAGSEGPTGGTRLSLDDGSPDPLHRPATFDDGDLDPDDAVEGDGSDGPTDTAGTDGQAGTVDPGPAGVDSPDRPGVVRRLLRRIAAMF